MSKPKDAQPLALFQGTLDLLVLRVLTSGPQHGYAISTRLAELSDDWLIVEEGSLYPCLYRMERKGWIHSRQGQTELNRRARYYSLTPTGREQLTNEEDSWRQFQRVVDRVLKKA